MRFAALRIIKRNMSDHFDVIMIGSGSASKITRPDALGNNVAVIERGRMGIST